MEKVAKVAKMAKGLLANSKPPMFLKRSNLNLDLSHLICTY
jgi:hypothetical protein